MMNPVLHHNMAVAVWADNPFVRGFVTGFGLIHLLVGVRDIVAIARERRTAGGQ